MESGKFDQLQNNVILLSRAKLSDIHEVIFEVKRKNINVLSPENLESACEYTCKHCREPINSIQSTGAYLYLEGKTKCILCNNCIDIYPSAVTSAKVYLKVFSGIKNIEITNINNFYENSISYGHKFN